MGGTASRAVWELAHRVVQGDSEILSVGKLLLGTCMYTVAGMVKPSMFILLLDEVL